MLELDPEQKLAGVLAPLFALRGEKDLGIGDTAALKELLTWAADLGLRVVQILPINETGNDNSPYNIISSMALDPLTIATTPDDLPDLTVRDFEKITARFNLPSLRQDAVQYAKIRVMKRALLAAAFRNFRSRSKKSSSARHRRFQEFQDENQEWLQEYCLYRALLDFNGGSEIMDTWEPAHRTKASATSWMAGAAPSTKRKVRDLMRFHAYVQWVAASQWADVRQHCDSLGVGLIGDIPVGVSLHGCDVWAEPGIFDLRRSSGAPPERVFQTDPFTAKWGQNWGFPLYRWEQMSHDNFGWWRRRLRGMLGMFHLIRVDHALGFFRIYSFPWRPERNDEFLDLTLDQVRERTGGLVPAFIPHDDSTPQNREANRRQGELLFRILLEETGPLRLIAEDLGEVAPYVRPTLAALEIPGFKIPQWEKEDDGTLTPGKDYERLSLATYATHDHPPLKTLWTALAATAASEDASLAAEAKHEMRLLLDFCGLSNLSVPQPFTPQVHAALLTALFSSNAWLAVNTLTDLLGRDERFNVPGAVGSKNWSCRLPEPIHRLARQYHGTLQMIRRKLTETGRLQN